VIKIIFNFLLMNIRPLGNRVVVKAVKEEEVTSFGIVLPDTAQKEKKAEGEIVAVGPGKLLESGQRGPVEVRVGDRVIFEKWGGEEVKVGDQEYKILEADKILAIIEKN
jgi:chaperonin GroES